MGNNLVVVKPAMSSFMIFDDMAARWRESVVFRTVKGRRARERDRSRRNGIAVMRLIPGKNRSSHSSARQSQGYDQRNALPSGIQVGHRAVAGIGECVAHVHWISPRTNCVTARE